MKNKLTYIFIFIFCFGFFSCQNKKKAMEYFDTAVDRIKSSDDGTEKVDTIEIKLAIFDLTKAIDLLPTFWNAYFMRACCYRSIGDYISALADYNKAIETADKSSIASLYNDRAEVNLILKNYEEAIADYNIAIREFVFNPYAYIGRARAKLKIGLIDEACKDFIAAVTLDSSLIKLDEFKQCTK